MIETGRVIAVEPDGLWVETIQQSTCASCSVKKGCGQGLMAGHSDGKRNQLKISLGGRIADQSLLNRQVSFEVADGVVLGGAALVYLLPLVAMLVGGAVAANYTSSDAIAALAGAGGFASALLVARLVISRLTDNARYEPQLVEVFTVSQVSQA